MRKATDVFGEWARIGKDEGMEEGHASSVDEMLIFSLKERNLINKSFNFLDLGCGNGWVIRKVVKENLCDVALGVDGAEDMVSNAKSRGKEEHYIHADITTYEPTLKFDLVHYSFIQYLI